METHKLLSRQIKKFIPEINLEDEQIKKFLHAISESYIGYERDKELSNHAFALSEKEYHDINKRLKGEIETRRISIARLKETILKIDGESKINMAGDDLVTIVDYIEQLVAKRKKIENDLTQNVERMTSLISNLHSGILMENEKREIIFTNEIFCKMFGIPASPIDLIGTDCSRSAENSKALFLDPEKFCNGVDELIKSRKLSKGDVLELKDGRFFERDFVPIYLNNEYKGHLWNYSDITQKTKAEQALAASEEKYRSIIANMNLGLLEVDNDDKVQFCNQSFMDISGFTLEEIKGAKAGQLFMSGFAEKQLEEKRKMRLKGQSDSFEILVKNKRGEERWWLISGAPNYNEKGEVIGSIGIHLDITEQKRLERELEIALEKAQIASKAKEAFLANMSHEIRTPLNAIIGMVRELGKENLTPQQNSYLSNSDTAAKHLLSMVNNILDISKIEAGELDFDEKDFSLESVVNMVQSILHIKAREKDLDLRTIISEDIKPALIGDGSRIRQILINLIGNSIKFTEKGYVELEVSVKESSPAFQKVLFKITDTGIGMSSSFLSSVFDKFSQEDSNSVRRIEGSGLGMAITKEIINVMGGHMHISSEQGVGTIVEFCLNLPVGDPTKILSKKEVMIDQSLAGLRCLLVEDNEMNRLIANRSLEYFGIHVTEAIDGKKAIECLTNQSFDFVLMDIQMPVMDGIETTKHIRNVMKNKVPIIALTANAFKSDIEQYLAIGMNDFVTKPFDEPVLFNAIVNVLNKHLDIKEPSNVEIKEVIQKKLYDLTILNEISKGDQGFVKKMLSLFLEQANLYVGELEQSLSKGDYLQISKSSHKIKPNIANMGIHHLVKPIKELEIICKEEKVDESKVSEIVVEVVKEMREVIHQMDNDLK